MIQLSSQDSCPKAERPKSEQKCGISNVWFNGRCLGLELKSNVRKPNVFRFQTFTVHILFVSGTRETMLERRL